MKVVNVDDSGRAQSLARVATGPVRAILGDSSHPSRERLPRRLASVPRVALVLFALITLLTTTGPPSLASRSAAVTSFQLSVDETTTFGACPTGTPPGVVCAQGGGPGQSTVLGAVDESFTAQIDPTHPNPDGTWPILSNVTLTIRTGASLVLRATGAYNAVQGTDSESFQVVGGSGALATTTGSGTVQTVTTGQSGGSVTSVSTYSGTLTNYFPWKYYFPIAGGG